MQEADPDQLGQLGQYCQTYLGLLPEAWRRSEAEID